MKKSALILSVISAVLIAAGVVLLVFTPNMLTANNYIIGAENAGDVFKIIWERFPNEIASIFQPDFYKKPSDPSQLELVLFILPVLLGALAIAWLIHLVLLIAKNRPNALAPNLLGLVFGLVGFVLIDMFLSPTWWFDGIANLAAYVSEIAQLTPENGGGAGVAILIALPYLLGAIGLALAFASFIISMVDVCKYPGITKVDDDEYGTMDEPLYDASATQEGANLRETLNSELKPVAAVASNAPVIPAVVNKDGYTGSSPTIVQYIYNNGAPQGPASREEKPLTKEELRSLIQEEMAKKDGTLPEDDTQAVNQNDLMTTDDLRSIIREEVGKAENKNEAIPTSNKNEKESTDSQALTSDDLRQIIAEEIAKAKGDDIPVEVVEDETSEDKEEQALTSDDLRRIIAEEIARADGKTIPEPKNDDKKDECNTLTSDDLREIIREELTKKRNVEDAETIGSNEDASSNEALTSDDLRKIVSEELKKVLAPEEQKVEEEEESIATTDDLRSIIRDELNHQMESEAPVIEEVKEEEKPLTANDLRSLIQEALEEHDNPERRELTEDEARELIVEQIRSYYIGKREDEKRDSQAVKAQKEAEEKAKKEEERRLALEKTLEDEVAARAKEREERELDRKERIEAEKNRDAVSLEEIREIVRSEIGEIKPLASKVDETSKEDIKDLIRSELTSFRNEQAKANAKAAQEAADAHLIEQARAEAEAEESKAQSEEIKNIKANAVTSDDVRSIIVEELDKRFEALLKAQEDKKAEPLPLESKKEEPAPSQSPTQTIVIQVAQPAEPKKEEPKPVVEKVAESEPTPTEVEVDEAEEDDSETPTIDKEKQKIIRIPFNERMLSADKETQSNYNELKAECLSYGLKSRLSNSGDSFRLHTKTYVKITVAGKGLKLYLALNPKDYENSPIPLHDAGAKNIYKEIPGVFKVKSALSLRRAKQLIADACEQDSLEQGKIIPHNYASELKDYVPQLGAKKDEKDDD